MYWHAWMQNIRRASACVYQCHAWTYSCVGAVRPISEPEARVVGVLVFAIRSLNHRESTMAWFVYLNSISSALYSTYAGLLGSGLAMPVKLISPAPVSQTQVGWPSTGVHCCASVTVPWQHARRDTKKRVSLEKAIITEPHPIVSCTLPGPRANRIHSV